MSHLRPRFCLYILGNFGHARSEDGRQPTAANRPGSTYCIECDIYLWLGWLGWGLVVLGLC